MILYNDKEFLSNGSSSKYLILRDEVLQKFLILKL